MAHNMRPATTVSFIAQIFIFGRSFQCAYRKTKPSRLLPNAKDGTELCKSGQNNLTIPPRSRAGGHISRKAMDYSSIFWSLGTCLISISIPADLSSSIISRSASLANTVGESRCIASLRGLVPPIFIWVIASKPLASL